MEQPTYRILGKYTHSIIRKMQQTKTGKRKSAPVQQKRNTLNPVSLKPVQQTCRNYRKLQQTSTRSGASGRRTTRNSTSRSLRTGVLSAGRKGRGSWRNSPGNDGRERKASGTPGGCAGRVMRQP